MMRSRLEKVLLGTTAAALAALVPWFVSCATKDDTGAAAEDDAGSNVLPEASADATSGDAEPEAGCDASDSTCTASVLTCAEAAWCPVPTTVSTLYTLTAVWGSSKTDLWAVGSGGTIIHGDGATWTATPTGVKNMFHAVWGSGPNDVWAVSMTDALFHSTGFASGKATWTKAPAAKAEPNDQYPRAVFAIWGAGEGHLRIGARDRTVFDPDTGDLLAYNQYTKTIADGGVAWTPTVGIGAVHGFWGSSESDLWYVSDNSERNGWQKGVTMHGTPGGDGGAMTWTAVDSQATVVLEGIWGSGPSDLWAVGDKGAIRHFGTGATRWDIVPSPTTEALHAVWGTAPNNVWAVGDFGTILHYDGKTWRPSKAAFPVGKKKHLLGIWGSSANDVWIVGDGISLHYTGPKPGDQGDVQ